MAIPLLFGNALLIIEKKRILRWRGGQYLYSLAVAWKRLSHIRHLSVTYL
jgi:hypothetical protein